MAFRYKKRRTFRPRRRYGWKRKKTVQVSRPTALRGRGASFGLRKRIQRMQRSVNAFMQRDQWVSVFNATRLSTNTYTIFDLANPTSWTRQFGVTNTAELTGKESIDWDYSKMRFRADFNGATAGEHTLNCFLVALSRLGKRRYPSGLPGGVLAAGSEYSANQGTAQVALNPEVFKVYRSWEWTISSAQSNAGIASTTVLAQDQNCWFKHKNINVRMNCKLNAETGWSTMINRDMPCTKALCLLVFHSLTTSTGAGTAPTMSIQQINYTKTCQT